MTDDELFADWQTGVRQIYDDLSLSGWNRLMFKMMREVVNNNARVRETGGHFVDWMFTNYLLSAAMSFRRDVDQQGTAV